MNLLLPLLILALAALLMVWLLRPVATYRKYRGKRLITCPETRRGATVEVAAAEAAAMAAFGEHVIELKNCSRWPEKKDCGQECVAQIEASPEGCLLRNIAETWYAGKHCCRCQQSVDPATWHGHFPALAKPGGRPVQWTSFTSEMLPEVFAQYEPVCWNCFVAESVRRSFPDLITDREETVERSA